MSKEDNLRSKGKVFSIADYEGAVDVPVANLIEDDRFIDWIRGLDDASYVNVCEQITNLVADMMVIPEEVRERVREEFPFSKQGARKLGDWLNDLEDKVRGEG